MTHLRCVLLGMLLLGGVVHAQNRAPVADAPVKLDKAKLSYAIGYQIGSQFADGRPDVDVSVLLRAIQDAYAKRNPTVSMQEMALATAQLERQMRCIPMRWPNSSGLPKPMHARAPSSWRATDNSRAWCSCLRASSTRC